jgi:hypothetical protein
MYVDKDVLTHLRYESLRKKTKAKKLNKAGPMGKNN